MDPVERALQDMADRLQEAWRAQNCLTCPIGELAALAAATLVFYQQQKEVSHD